VPTLQGLVSAAYAGLLGYFFGAVPSLIRHQGRAWGLVHAEGLRSAKQLTIMSGLYTAVHCICGRIRLKEDGWNRGVAGCSTGLVLGWAAGPWGAAQSCLGIGAISYFLDFGEVAGGATMAAPATAATLTPAGAPAAASSSGQGALLDGMRQLQRHLLAPPLASSPVAALALPPLMWLGGCCGTAAAASGSGSGSGSGSSLPTACPLDQPKQQSGGSTEQR
jgi:import inner membrane translocase subunit TIM22